MLKIGRSSMKRKLENLWSGRREKISEAAFLTKQYLKLIQVLVYAETNDIPLAPVLLLLEDNVETRKKMQGYSRRILSERI
jgi:hypothetical protein